MQEEKMIEILLLVLKKTELSSLILSQIKKFQNQGITNKQIARSVVYYYEEKGGDLEKLGTYGIGIVPRIFKEADAFYNRISQEQEDAKKDALSKKDLINNIPVIKVQPLKRVFNRKEYDLNE